MAPDGLRHAVCLAALQSCSAHPRWHWGHGCREFEPLARLVRWFHGGWPSLAQTVSREPSCRLNVALVCTCRLCTHLVYLYIVADCCTHPNSFCLTRHNLPYVAGAYLFWQQEVILLAQSLFTPISHSHRTSPDRNLCLQHTLMCQGQSQQVRLPSPHAPLHTFRRHPQWVLSSNYCMSNFRSLPQQLQIPAFDILIQSNTSYSQDAEELIPLEHRSTVVLHFWGEGNSSKSIWFNLYLLLLLLLLWRFRPCGAPSLHSSGNASGAGCSSTCLLGGWTGPESLRVLNVLFSNTKGMDL